MTQSFPITKPSLYDVMQQLKEDIFSTLRVCVPGQVVSFDGTKGTATIKVLLKRVLDDETQVDYKPLLDCPVLTPQGGGAFIQFPIAAGDQGIVVFADRNIGSWFQNGDNTAMPDLRAHNLSDGIFIPGINSLKASLPTWPTNKVLVKYAGSTIEIDSAGIKLIGTGGAELDLQTTLTTIKNGTTTLNTLIGAFLTMMEALTIADDEGGAILPLTAASIAAIEAFRAQFTGLLG